MYLVSTFHGHHHIANEQEVPLCIRRSKVRHRNGQTDIGGFRVERIDGVWELIHWKLVETVDETKLCGRCARLTDAC